MNIETFVTTNTDGTRVLGNVWVRGVSQAEKDKLPKALQNQLVRYSDGTFELRSAIVLYANNATGDINETGLKKLVTLIAVGEANGGVVTTNSQAVNAANLDDIKSFLRGFRPTKSSKVVIPDVPRLDAHVDSLLELEESTANKAVDPLRKPFAKLLTLLHAVWPGDQASQVAKKAALNRLNTEVFMDVLSQAEAEILKGALAALEHGINTGLAQAGLRGSALDKSFKRTLATEAHGWVRATHEVARRRVDLGTAVLGQSTTLVEAQTGLALANPGVNVSRHARWVTNRVSNEGITVVGEADPRSVLVWRAERDACVHCLAYQGHARVGGSYPAGLTFGKKPLSTSPVLMPPLHPNCRCTQWVLARDVAQAVQESLLREAQRSILRGWSVESESNTVRVDAARRLLAKNPTMPKSVQAYARSAVKAGEFKRGRAIPM